MTEADAMVFVVDDDEGDAPIAEEPRRVCRAAGRGLRLGSRVLAQQAHRTCPAAWCSTCACRA